MLYTIIAYFSNGNNLNLPPHSTLISYLQVHITLLLSTKASVDFCVDFIIYVSLFSLGIWVFVCNNHQFWIFDWCICCPINGQNILQEDFNVHGITSCWCSRWKWDFSSYTKCKLQLDFFIHIRNQFLTRGGSILI